ERTVRVGHMDAETIYQTSTISALLSGVYDGDTTIAELLRHGDFGLGTFNQLDGEMVILDGVCHHLHASGAATIAGSDDRTPYAAVAGFTPEITVPVTSPGTRQATTALIDKAITSPNLVQGIRISGQFRHVRNRTVAAQRPPYPPLTEATAA